MVVEKSDQMEIVLMFISALAGATIQPIFNWLSSRKKTIAETKKLDVDGEVSIANVALDFVKTIRQEIQVQKKEIEALHLQKEKALLQRDKAASEAEEWKKKYYDLSESGVE